MEITTKFSIRDVVQMHTHDIHPKRFYDAIDGNMVCGVVVQIIVDSYEEIYYLVKRNTHVDEKVRLYAEWELELVPTAPERTPPAPPQNETTATKPETSAGEGWPPKPDPLGIKLFLELKDLNQYFHDKKNKIAAVRTLEVLKRFETEYKELTTPPAPDDKTVINDEIFSGKPAHIDDRP